MPECVYKHEALGSIPSTTEKGKESQVRSVESASQAAFKPVLFKVPSPMESDLPRSRTLYEEVESGKD